MKIVQITADNDNLYALTADGVLWLQTQRTSWKKVDTAIILKDGAKGPEVDLDEHDARNG